MFHDFGRNNHLLMLSLFVWALGEGLWINLRQLYLADLGATPVQVGTALAVESIARAILLIPTGYLADRFGPFRVVIASWILGIAGPLLMIPARTWQMAVPGLVVYAMSAFAIPSVSAMALLSLPDKTLPGINQRVLTAIFAAYAGGLILSPTLGGLIADRWGIRTGLWLGAGVFTVSLLVLLLARRVEPAERAHEERPRDLLRNRAFLGLAAYFAFASFTFILAYALAPNFLEEVRGFSRADIGLLFSIFALGTVVANLVVGRISPRWNYAAVLLFLGVAVFGVWRLAGLVPMAAAFFGFGAIWSARTLAMANLAAVVRPANRGLAFGAAETLIAAATGVSSRVAGGIYASTPAHDRPFIGALIGIMVLLALWFVVRPAQTAPVVEARPVAVLGD